MKQLILIGLLTCLGVAQITVTPQEICACQQLVYQDDCNNMPGCTWSTNVCVQQTCSKYTQQSDCLKASKYCTWNSTATTCGTFNGCSSIKIASKDQYKQCGQSNLQCASYDGTSCQQLNKLTTQCSDYSDTYCTENIGSDGVCVWSNAQSTCGPITLCTQATQKSQCALLNNKNGLACQWTGDPGTCTQITNCGAFTKDTCKYYFPSLTSPNMILCSWNGTACVSATNSRYLTSTNCLTGTGYNYRWLPTASDQTIGICATCSTIQIPNLTLLTSKQCECPQYILQTECNQTYCSWNAIYKTCGPITCGAVKSQSVCIQIQACYWDFKNGGCTSYGQQTCANLPTTISAIACAAQSIYCAGFNGKQCQTPTTTCSGATTQQGCQNFAGTDGICKWANGICAPLKQCEQILDPVYCGSWQNQCLWDAEAQICSPLTCAKYTASKCTYVFTSFEQTDYQLCRYNVSTKQCESVNNGLSLTAQNCSSNTGNTYRWTSTVTTTGMCVSCSMKAITLQTKASCTCGQFTNELDCNNSGYCTFSGQCVPQTCPLITNQQTCASLANCAWSSTGCVAFTQCSNLQATNQLGCVAQNASCKGFAGGVCSSSIPSVCLNNSTQTCANAIGSDGVCYLNGDQCLAFSSCTGVIQKICDKNPFACYWNSKTQTCQPQTCSNFVTASNCKFYIPSPNSSQVIPCTWSNNTCSVASEVMSQLTSTTCATNTHSTYRWIQTSNHGYCVKCQQQPTLKNQCPCSYIVTQADCGQALDCQWVTAGYTSSCQQQQCSQIYLQSVCATQLTCAWVNGVCTNFTSCNLLAGSTQFQCVSQQSTCVGTNGKNCTTTLNSCGSYLASNACINQYGNDGECYWDNNQCLAALQCSDLSEAYCNLRYNSCIYSNAKCQTLTCEQLEPTNCTFVVSLTNKSRVQTCVLVNNQCTSTNDPFQLPESTCFSNSARTARWIPTQGKVTGICQTCARPLVNPNVVGKCQCQQYFTQSDCQNEITSCTWANGGCQNACNTITNSQQCAQNPSCGWTITSSGGYCSNFVSCETANGSNQQSCLAYSILCQGYNGINCTVVPSEQCSNQVKCNGSVGSDGICLLNTKVTPNICQGTTKCSDIGDPKICNLYDNACAWVNQACVGFTCSSFTTPATCGYYITSIYKGGIQLCQWDSQTKSCSNLKNFSNKNSLNCGVDTSFTYRWVPKLTQTPTNEGYCATCAPNFIPIPGQCLCSQVFSEMECSQNSRCLWDKNSNTCQNISCSAITQQSICASNPRCAWSAATYLCQPFTSCSDLAGVNAFECLSYSTFCGGINDKILHNQKYACANTPSTGCESASSSPNQCENTIVQGGLCVMQANGGNPQCVKATQCYDIQNQQICQSLPHICQWRDSMCLSLPIMCNGLSQENCTYILGFWSGSVIQYCQWEKGGCQNVVNPSQNRLATQESCYRDSLMTYRWSSETPSGGKCVTCSQYPTTFQPKPFCSCSQLSEAECTIAYPQCVYVSPSCSEITNCTSISYFTQCSQNRNCMVSNRTCIKFTSCDSLVGFNQLQCAQGSINCPYFSNGKCSAPPKCSSFNNETSCNNYNTKIETNYCYWDSSACKPIENCADISDFELCGLQNKRCQWSGLFNKCIVLTCSSYNTPSACTFVYTSFTPSDVALCQWDEETHYCSSALASVVQNYNDTQCYVNTGYTYHYDGSICAQCQSFQTMLTIIVIYLIV